MGLELPADGGEVRLGGLTCLRACRGFLVRAPSNCRSFHSPGSGQLTPASAAAFRYSWTVL